jgi:hypothetical protein
MQDQPHREIENSAATRAIAPAIFNHVIASLTHQDNQLIECGLTCQIPVDIYKIIEKHDFFNLKPELRSHSISFATDTDITLKATLHPDRLPDFADGLGIGERECDR